MGTRRYGNRVVSDLSRAILFIIKRGASSADEIVDLLNNSFQEKQIRSRISHLKYEKFVAAEGDSLKVTVKGILKLDSLEFKAIVYNKPWDKQWRLVIYDIPESKRLARDKIRQLLKDLGFRQLQISVWAHPMPCLKQFQIIKKAYGIENHLLLLEVNDTVEFKDLKRSFEKQYTQLNYR